MPFETSLSQEDRDFAKKDLGEYSRVIDSALTILKDRIALEPGLKANLDDAFLIKFLRVRKYDMDRAMQLLKNYYAGRNMDFLQDLRPSTVQKAIELGFSTPMKGYNSRDGTKVIVFRPGQWQEGLFPFTDLMRCQTIVAEHQLQNEHVQVYGIRYVMDGTDVGWDHAKVIASGIIPRYMKVLQDAMPMRIKGFHYINEPAMMSYIFSFIKPVLKEKTAKRIHFHGSDLSSLHEHVDKDCLPESLGGTQPNPPNPDFVKDLLGSEEYFQEMQKYYFDDPKAIFKLQSEDAQDSGVGGTYRKLNVD